MAIIPGTPGADLININQLFDLVLPSAGNDTITDNDASPFGLDLVFGGAGDDKFVSGKGLNIFDGGAGSDTIDYVNSTAGVTVDMAAGTGTNGVDRLDIFSNVENVSGSNFADNIKGDAGDNVIESRAGNDVVDAGDGNDIVRAGDGDDVVKGGKGDDQLFGQQGNDQLSGGEGNDTLRGGQGDDSLSGGAGNDDLRGGQGKDILDGGLGADKMDVSQGDDVVFYNTMGESTAAASDLITGFGAGDKIDLSSIDANVDQAGNQAFQYVAHDPTKPLEAGQVTSHFDAVSGKTIVEAYNGAETLHTELEGNVPLNQNDFVL